MRSSYLLALLLLCACAGAEPAPLASVTVPNFDADSPACVVKLPETKGSCTAKGCSMPLPARSTLKSIQLKFSCIPSWMPNGFDKSPDYAKVLSLRARNANGNLSLIDDIDGEPADRMRSLRFCLYSKETSFCGSAKVLRLKDGAEGDATAAIKRFIEGIELQEPSK